MLRIGKKILWELMVFKPSVIQLLYVQCFHFVKTKAYKVMLQYSSYYIGFFGLWYELYCSFIYVLTIYYVSALDILFPPRSLLPLLQSLCSYFNYYPILFLIFTRAKTMLKRIIITIFHFLWMKESRASKQ